MKKISHGKLYKLRAQEAAAAYQKFKDLDQTARHLKKSVATIQQQLKFAGVKVPRRGGGMRPETRKRKEKVEMLRKQGLGWRRIGKALGIAPQRALQIFQIKAPKSP